MQQSVLSTPFLSTRGGSSNMQELSEKEIRRRTTWKKAKNAMYTWFLVIKYIYIYLQILNPNSQNVHLSYWSLCQSRNLKNRQWIHRSTWSCSGENQISSQNYQLQQNCNEQKDFYIYIHKVICFSLDNLSVYYRHYSIYYRDKNRAGFRPWVQKHQI